MFSALIRTTDGESGCGVLGSSSAAYEVSDRLAFASDSGPASELQSMHAPSWLPVLRGGRQPSYQKSHHGRHNA